MKKKHLYIRGAKHWNNLLRRFSKLQKRLQLLAINKSNRQYKKLVNKLQYVFSKLEKMQYQTGIKLAGTSLAIALSTLSAKAQFLDGVPVKYTGEIFQEGLSRSAFADLDNDGDNDLYVGNNDGKVEVFTNNNGAYTFTGLLQADGFAVNVSNAASPIFADIDGDNDLDLYVGRSSGKVNFYLNNNGTFNNQGLIQVNGVAIDVGSGAAPELADIDGDGDLDLYVGNAAGEVREFLNTNGTFSGGGLLGLTGSTSIATYVGGYSAPSFADIDADGDLDLYVGTAGGFVRLFSNNGGAFTHVNQIQADGSAIMGGSNFTPSFNDVDGDGDLDLYLNRGNSKISVFTNTGGLFSADGFVEASDLNITADGYTNPTFKDIDSDGDLDLYVGNYDGKIQVFNNTNGVYIENGKLQAGGNNIDVGDRSAPTFADIDNDGDLDLYVGNYEGKINVFNNTNGNFIVATNPNLLNNTGGTIDIGYHAQPTFADIDGDGDLDLYVGSYYGEVKVFTNNTGVFTPAPDLQADAVNIDVGYGAVPTFADLDGDGDLDLYVGQDNGSVSIFTNTNGVFSANGFMQVNSVNIDAGSYTAPTFADMDNDGDLDLYLGNSAGEVTFYENTSAAAVLVSSITIQGQGGVSSITTAGGTLQIEATVLPVNAANSTYTWSVNNGSGSATIDANGLLTATGNGIVSVLASANDASGVSTSTIITISNQTSVGINEVTVQNVTLYPNPVQGHLFIEVKDQEITSVEIIDFSGRNILSSNDIKSSLDVSNLVLGVYFIKIETSEGIVTKRFVKK